jgi:heme/copper-type cytochrome/quinol oxidase subunit 2
MKAWMDFFTQWLLISVAVVLILIVALVWLMMSVWEQKYNDKKRRHIK